jgi:glycosyltransferase involved in cell wall biosynthesis
MKKIAGAVVHAAVNREQIGALVPSIPTTVVPHPPNIELQPTPLPAWPPLRVLFFGYVRPYKGLSVAIDAIAILRERNFDARMTVAGRFWDSIEGYDRQIRHHGIGSFVELLPGYVSDAMAQTLFSNHHVVVAPYRDATQSGIVPLAFAAGRPVVATRVGGLEEAVSDGEDGILCDPDDPHALAEAIVATSQRLETMAGSAARAAISWSEVALAVVQVSCR